MPGPEEREKTDCWGMVHHWDGECDEEMTAASGGRDQGLGRRLLLDPGQASGFEEQLFVDHEEDVRSVMPSSMNDSPEARKDWPVVDRAVEDVEVGDAVEGHERTGRGHERNDYWLDRNGSDLLGWQKGEGESQQRGTKGEHDSYVAVEEADAGYVLGHLRLNLGDGGCAGWWWNRISMNIRGGEGDINGDGGNGNCRWQQRRGSASILADSGTGFSWSCRNTMQDMPKLEGVKPTIGKGVEGGPTKM
ncbi:hypothetical protein F5888DRAFT_1632941 [Russula emetica]|nr:hypothetical protein F5888DRAFT_1632941 [Russula emetica]